MEKIFVVAGSRTPFGAFGGGLRDITATDLMVMAGNGALKASGIAKEDIDHIVIGNVAQSAADAPYLARHVGLKMGLPIATPAYNVNRLCGSGFQSWVNAAQMILTGEAKCILAGGVEQMSQIPYVARNVRFQGYRMGHAELEDSLNSSLTDAYANLPMAMTAENLGEKYDITREQCDRFSIRSQERTKLASEKGYFATEITSVKIESKKGVIEIAKDEHPKPEATFEKISTMKSLFKKEGLVTAATASGIVDGAAATFICSESFVKAKGLKPLAQIISYASVGCDPKIMGIGPAGAARMALQKAKMELKQMDLVEVNEAFAAQYLAVEKELGLNPEITNVNGGAIAVGHPLGASGTRIMNHLVFELARRNKKYALGSACIGGGQGIALIIERV